MKTPIINILKYENGIWIGYVRDMPKIISQGHTIKELERNIRKELENRIVPKWEELLNECKPTNITKEIKDDGWFDN